MIRRYRILLILSYVLITLIPIIVAFTCIYSFTIGNASMGTIFGILIPLTILLDLIVLYDVAFIYFTQKDKRMEERIEYLKTKEHASKVNTFIENYNETKRE